MRRKCCIVVIMALGLTLWGFADAVAATGGRPLPVKVPHDPSPAGKLAIGFHPRETLPSGGYYYAVVVLNAYYAQDLSSAGCANTSSMLAAEYAYPTPAQPVALMLRPEASSHWCSGATYVGAIYAVPHPPPCPKYEPCYGHSTAPECYEGEGYCREGKRVPANGELAMWPSHSGVPPEPRDSSTRIIAHFRVQFPPQSPGPMRIKVERHPSITETLKLTFLPGEALHNGGYYYAVAVLSGKDARHPPTARCAKTVNVNATDYAYPHPGRPVALRLGPHTLRWCPGATYIGGIYAVPHGKPCPFLSGCDGKPGCYEGEQLCTGEGSPGNHPVGDRRTPPGELPKPKDRSVRLIARFHVHF